MSYKMNRVIFLDIDGVLTSARVHSALGDSGFWHSFDPIAVDCIKRICFHHKFQIVISSTWRHDQHKDDLDGALIKADLKQFLHKDWKTPVTMRERGQEIVMWLDDHKDVLEYIIIDDVVYPITPYIDHEEYIVETDPDNGLTYKNYVKILSIIRNFDEDPL